jgi:hypothetical protein
MGQQAADTFLAKSEVTSLCEPGRQPSSFRPGSSPYTSPDPSARKLPTRGTAAPTSLPRRAVRCNRHLTYLADLVSLCNIIVAHPWPGGVGSDPAGNGRGACSRPERSGPLSAIVRGSKPAARAVNRLPGCRVHGCSWPHRPAVARGQLPSAAAASPGVTPVQAIAC